MKIEQLRFNGSWEETSFGLGDEADIVFTFGYCDAFKTEEYFNSLKEIFPKAKIVGCSTAGTILEDKLTLGDAVATAVSFESSEVKIASRSIENADDSFTVGQELAKELSGNGLQHIIVFSDGLNVNGSTLANGFNSVKEEGVYISGGLAGDDVNFETTYIIADAPAQSKVVVAVGIYGDAKIKTGCYAGWEEFGTDRVVTKSLGNVVYEIDNEPALKLYKSYLGDQAKDLPSSGLHFPLKVFDEESNTNIIRTLLAVSEEEQSLTFAGDVNNGSVCRLMKTNINKLIEHAGMAAEDAKEDSMGNVLTLAVSCVGRRLVLKQLAEEELDIILETIGDNCFLTGFYSYGELAPISGFKDCKLHNQTMTITAIYE